MSQLKLNIDDLTEIIIGCAFTTHNELGAGFLEKVYENALKIELENNDLNVRQQFPVPVYYKKHLVGDFYADLFIEDRLIVELKAVENLKKEHEVQVVNYLAATSQDIGLLINFGSSVTVKRKYREYRKI